VFTLNYYNSAQNISTPFDALNEREIGRKFPDSRAFMSVPVSIDGKTIRVSPRIQEVVLVN
jgi:hypothetical protein